MTVMTASLMRLQAYGAAVNTPEGYEGLPSRTAPSSLASNQGNKMQRLVDRKPPDRYRMREYIEVSFAKSTIRKVSAPKTSPMSPHECVSATKPPSASGATRPNEMYKWC